jgi:hypothetical protein
MTITAPGPAGTAHVLPADSGTNTAAFQPGPTSPPPPPRPPAPPRPRLSYAGHLPIGVDAHEPDPPHRPRPSPGVAYCCRFCLLRWTG